MDKRYQILYYIHKQGFLSQRAVSKGTGISVGLVNALLKQLEEEGCLTQQEKDYSLTDKGIVYLEESIAKSRNQKLVLSGSENPVREAVILAAGENDEFHCPVGMLPVEGVPMVEYIINYLRELEIEKIVMVVGYGEELFREHFRGRDICFVSNSRYHWTGTMASLAQAEQEISGDFLLIESNQIFQPSALRQILEAQADNAMLLVNPSGSMDEAYVELDSQGNIFRVSKDIRQMNRIDGELVGISKISQALFGKMMEYYRGNENPHLNYEYVIENLGRTYQIPGLRADDLPWTVVENEEHYRQAQEAVFPRILKREKLYRENAAREVFLEHMDMQPEEVRKFQVCGGMTNTNFYVKTDRGEYILRIPGAGTDQMIDRTQEETNGRLGSRLGINIPNLYFNRDTGVKITAYIPQAETLNPRTARWESNMKKVTDLLRRLHQSGLYMDNEFSVRKEYERYKDQAREVRGKYYQDFQMMDEWFYHLMNRLDQMEIDKCTCHNDLVAENFIKDCQGRMYLIDWEYAGMNDPMWDLAAHLLECGFSPREEELFLQYYFQKEIPPQWTERIAIHKMCQDILWSIWTVIKEAKGEDFGTYGRERLERAVTMRKEYIRRYEEDK